MKTWMKAVWACALTALSMGAGAKADFLGISVFQEAPGPGPAPGGNPRWIWRVYANLSSPTDRVNLWGGGGNLGPGVIQNVMADGVTPGSGFTNIDGVAGQISPFTPGTTRDYDSYMTVGILYGQEAPAGVDATLLIPGTPTFIAGSTWTAPAAGGGVFITPDDPQGRANYRVTGNDTDTRVLLMQLVVNAGEYIRGTIGLSWSVQGVPGSGALIQNVNVPVVPAPAGLAALAMAAFCAPCRRRFRPGQA